jgi:hypothetical protein
LVDQGLKIEKSVFALTGGMEKESRFRQETYWLGGKVTREIARHLTQGKRINCSRANTPWRATEKHHHVVTNVAVTESE